MNQHPNVGEFLKLTPDEIDKLTRDEVLIRIGWS